MKIINVDNRRVKLQIWDTAGQERFESITKQFYTRAQVFSPFVFLKVHGLQQNGCYNKVFLTIHQNLFIGPPIPFLSKLSSLVGVSQHNSSTTYKGKNTLVLNLMHSGIVNGCQLLCYAHTVPEVHMGTTALFLYYSLSSFYDFSFCVSFSQSFFSCVLVFVLTI